ncbi:hypothetical protein IMY05_C4462000400 [Salix suchowensis]|nr:hypothetical protein IMY05_C4462000400 [Salix suchowensis]
MVLPPGIPHPHPGARPIGPPVSQATPTPPALLAGRGGRNNRGNIEPIQPTPPPPSFVCVGCEALDVEEPPSRQEVALSQTQSTPPGLPRLDSRLCQRIVAAFRRFEQRHSPGTSANTSAPSTHPDADGAASDAPAGQTNTAQPLGPQLRLNRSTIHGTRPLAHPRLLQLSLVVAQRRRAAPWEPVGFLRAVQEREHQLTLAHPLGKQVRVLEPLREESTTVLAGSSAVRRPNEFPRARNPGAGSPQASPISRTFLSRRHLVHDGRLHGRRHPAIPPPIPATSLPTPHASSPETSEETSGRPSLEPASENPTPTRKFNLTRPIQRHLQEHIAQLSIK